MELRWIKSRRKTLYGGWTKYRSTIKSQNRSPLERKSIPGYHKTLTTVFHNYFLVDKSSLDKAHFKFYFDFESHKLFIDFKNHMIPKLSQMLGHIHPRLHLSKVHLFIDFKNHMIPELNQMLRFIHQWLWQQFTRKTSKVDQELLNF